VIVYDQVVDSIRYGILYFRERGNVYTTFFVEFCFLERERERERDETEKRCEAHGSEVSS